MTSPSAAPRLDAPQVLSDLGAAGLADARARSRGCARPVRLRGSAGGYDSGRELDGQVYKRCQDRRAARCPSCSHEYKGDAWHLLVCGLSGGKGVPDSVAEQPAVFATLTAPSFGPVHGQRGSRPCRARRDRPCCPHGRPLFCLLRHRDDDPRLGEPLCGDCYDYPGQVLWQWHAPELFRRFGIALRRALAAALGMRDLRPVARLAYVKVVEFQARGVVHFHLAARLDGPAGPDSDPPPALTAPQLADAFRDAAVRTRLLVDDPRPDRPAVALRWGSEVDVRPLAAQAGRDDPTGPAHPRMAAAYLAKYLTKSTEDFGLTANVRTSRHAAAAGARGHVVRLLEVAEQLADAARQQADDRQDGPSDLVHVTRRCETLGYRGHPITKTRAYSTTFGALRRARSQWRRRRAGLYACAAVRELLDPADGDIADPAAGQAAGSWEYAGRGYLDLDAAGRAVASAVLARTRRASSPSGSLPVAAGS